MMKYPSFISSSMFISAVALAMLYLPACKKQAPAIAPLTHPGYHQQALGASAIDLLRADKFSSVTVEIQHMPGATPHAETIEKLDTFLQTHLNKPDGIFIKVKEVPTSSKQPLNKDDVVKLEQTHRKHFAVNRNLPLYILITNGSHSDKTILGMAYRNTSAVLFGGAIQRFSDGNNILTKAELETSVLLHEIGHLLDLGNPTASAFSSRTGKGRHNHCVNEMCLMFWKTETRNKAIINRKGRVPQLDENCRRELEAMGGKRDADVPAPELALFLSGF